ncbi:sugar kinase [Segetibacter sp.]|jgi:2-dehydro-3-deoxygluconokinase|uniref:sugar kinase n=1 Tax=Segetibacter sp. TaxID=2231182 RepID=UPI00261F2E06|nr:sugar kinase [Segetibacter sp.]MCW3079001.1 sugar kinase [Segetibacter sp.]
MSKKVLCFGELLLRISPALGGGKSGDQPMQVYVGGAEANVATALAGWNVPVKYCTVLPDNFMSKHVRHYLEYNNVFASSVLLAGNRIGVYYLERGADLKGSVIYDREHSAFSEVKRGMIDWDTVLHDVEWFNFSAISPALNENVADVCLEALEAASDKNITISVDLNYRSRLWKYGKEPIEVMPKLVAYCDVVMGNIWSANTLLGTAVDEHIHEKKSKEAYLDHARTTSKEIVEKFQKCKVVANTFRFDQKELLYYTTMYKDQQQYASTEFTTDRVVDRSGSGDCFMAGLIYGLYNDHAAQDIVNYAAAAAFGKLQEEGDATGHDILTVAKIETENKDAERGL